MNAQHKICKAQNRLRRIERRKRELLHDKAEEIIQAADKGREPNLSDIEAALNRLEKRRCQLS